MFLINDAIPVNHLTFAERDGYVSHRDHKEPQRDVAKTPKALHFGDVKDVMIWCSGRLVDYIKTYKVPREYVLNAC